MLGQSIFDVEGDDARGETYYVMSMMLHDGTLTQGIGRYLDDFARIDGEWRIRKRNVVTEWVGTVASTESGTAARLAFTQAARNPSDPSYRR